MSKVTNENKKIIEKNLDYIGLNLNKIPKFLNEFEPLNFRPVQSYDENLYKVYKYVDVKDIQILITPTDRLTDLKQRYKLAEPIFTYLDDKNEENIEKFANFLKMLTNLKIEDIEKLEEEQNRLKKEIPTKVRYENNFIWQIYYSEDTKKYFMLVPINEQDCSNMFYLLKKQLNSKKKETIFTPISHLEYSGTLLSKSEITDIENYLWYYTKDWASVYEVYDKKEQMCIKIVGTTNVYGKIRSDYVVTLKNKKEAIEFYKLLKAMFILSTGVEEDYRFTSHINKDGNLEFLNNDTVMTYDGLTEFIKSEYLNKIELLKQEIKDKSKLEKRLKRFNNIVEELTQEYLIKQKQIATFLECKKTFFGKVRYFFKKKKSDTPVVKKIEKSNRLDDVDVNKELENMYEIKEQYTIEDLISISSILNKKKKECVNIQLDINAIENKKEVLSKKVDNAELYIKEIDEHRKSIFEFWKFTNKDEVQTLNAGEQVEENKKDKLEKYFDYETDLDSLGKMVDELQRRKLSKTETDGIFAAKQVIESMRQLMKLKATKKDNETFDTKIFEKDLKDLQKEYKNDMEYINRKDFDIFGGMSDDKTKIKEIHNEKHREVEKDKYKVLNINLETDIETYIDNLKHYLNLILESLNKIHSPYNMSIYKIGDNSSVESLDIYNINPEIPLNVALNSKQTDISLCKINIKENTPIIYYSNIMFYDNFNKTLPLGMDLSSEVLIDIDKIKIELCNEEEFYINYSTDEFNNVTKHVKIYEYNADVM